MKTLNKNTLKTAIATIFFIFLIIHISSAQTPQFDWAVSAGGNEWDEAYGIATDKSGACIIAGLFQGTASFGAATLTAKKLTDIFVAKLDNTGKIKWAKSYGGDYIDAALDIAVDNTGGFAITGYCYDAFSIGSISLNPKGDRDIFIAKFNNSGAPVWAKRVGGSSYDAGSAIAADRSGNFFITGNFSGSAEFGTKIIATKGAQDIFIAKYSPDGSLLWVKGEGEKSEEFAEGIAVDNQGNSVIIGAFYYKTCFGGIHELRSNGSYDIFVVKYDVDGRIIWAKNFGGTDWDCGMSVATDGSDNIIITGYFRDSIKFDSVILNAKSHSYPDMFITKLSSSGEVLWAKRGGGIYKDNGKDIATDSKQNIYITGTISGGFGGASVDFGSTTLTAKGCDDVFIAKYNANGDVLWAKRAGSISTDRGNAVALDPDDNCYLAGSFHSDAEFDSYSLSSKATSCDIFVTRLKALESSTITVTSPNGGEKWEAGTTNTISWIGQNIDNYDVEIKYSTDNGKNWQFVDYQTNHGASGSYNWLVPNTPSSQCLVRLAVLLPPEISDVSDAVFEITSPTQTFTFSGHVYQGHKPATDVPMPGVIVQLHGDSDEWPANGNETQLAQVPTNGAGEFTLNSGTGNSNFNYYHVVEIDPKGAFSTGTDAPHPGYVKNVNCVSFQGSTLTLGQTYSGIGFWDLGGEAFVVTNTNDSGPGSLRAAMNHAISNPGFYHIRFQIPKSDPGYDAHIGVWRIMPLSPLPTITGECVIIDGETQTLFIGSDTNPNGPEIVLDGSKAGKEVNGISAHMAEFEVRSLTINNFKGGAGVYINDVQYASINGCYIGLQYNGGGKAGNYIGVFMHNNSSIVYVSPMNDTIPNVISGNLHGGIIISKHSGRNVIAGNIIGLDRKGEIAIGNGDYPGITLEECSDEMEIINNFIGGNLNGIRIDRASDAMVMNNMIGTNADWTLDVGNKEHGISILGSSQRNQIIKNYIGFSDSNGVCIDGGESNTLSENRISNNHGLGIKIINEGNKKIEPPIIQEAKDNIISGVAIPNAKIEIFSDDEDEGAKFHAMIHSENDGNFMMSIPFDDMLTNITATVTDDGGNTSMFSTPFMVDIETNIEDNSTNKTPETFTLHQNYPNPFNPETRISYNIPNPSYVVLKVMNVLGQEIRTLANEEKPAGQYEVLWDGRDNFGQCVASGVYLYRIESKDFIEMRKMVLLK